jgi:hypothetical protein
MIKLHIPRGVPAWVEPFRLSIERAIRGAGEMPTHSVADLPPAAGARRIIFVADEAGGAVIAFNDGSHWRRVTDRAVVS